MTLQDASTRTSVTEGTLPTASAAKAMTPNLIKFSFQGDELDVIPESDTLYVGVRRVCEALGVSFQGQVEKMKGDDSMGLKMILTPSKSGEQLTACVELRALPIWLATIYPSKVKPEVKEKLIVYKKEAAEVLANHFLGERGKGNKLVQPGVRMEVMTITPDMADQWLQKCNRQNRRLREKVVARYADDMKAGKWALTSQGIAFGPDGELIDGQHRLKAVLAAGVEVRMVVTFYEGHEQALDAKMKTDVGISRTIADALVLSDVMVRERGMQAVAVLAAIMLLETDSPVGLSTERAREMYASLQDAVDWALTNLSSREFTAVQRAPFVLAYQLFPEKVHAFAASIKNKVAGEGTWAQTYIQAQCSGSIKTKGGAPERRACMLKILRILKGELTGEIPFESKRLYAVDQGLDFIREQRKKRASLPSKDMA